MRVKRLQIAAVALLFGLSVLAVAGGNNYPWKNGHKFEIYRVDGVERMYEPGSRVHLEVLGRAISGKVEPEPKSGFNVQAYIDHPDLPEAATGANGTWDERLQGWVVELSAPRDARDSYRLQVSLYCSADPSPCTETYGRAAQVSETFHFDVR